MNRSLGLLLELGGKDYIDTGVFPVVIVINSSKKSSRNLVMRSIKGPILKRILKL